MSLASVGAELADAYVGSSVGGEETFQLLLSAISHASATEEASLVCTGVI